MTTRLHRIGRLLLLPSGEASRAEALVTLLRLRWFLRLRWAFVVLASLGLGIERWVMATYNRPPELFVLIGILAGLNILWTITSKAMRQGLERLPLFAEVHQSDDVEAALARASLFANVQIGADLLLLTAFLRYTGGVENPLAVCYLFHVVISALLLPALNALAQSCWGVILYAALALGELRGFISPHYPLLPGVTTPLSHDAPEFVAFAVFALAVGVFGALYFTTQITLRLDEQEHLLRSTNSELQQSRDAVRQLQARRAQFMRTAAHQLKSPLAGVQTLVGLLRDEVVPPHAVASTYRRIIQRCREGMDHVAELLALARVQDADPERHRQSHADVARIAADIVAQHTPSAQAAGVNLIAQFEDDGPLGVRVDARDLNEVLNNLIDNSLKYSRQGGAVRLEVRRKDRFVEIRVLDDGIGIDPESLPHIFEEYRRGQNALAKGIPGTGLGLSIVQTVVRQANGEVLVQSESGKGTEVLIRLPSDAVEETSVNASI